MGSEHYCLRWSNHQSNLLGVFSQLLQDESLVDVTLACSEGASIRAHKVVLSACSSYFQSLFLDHPEKHPIVILKDVRLSELQTLVEFMYKGEVNVQYCQLSALLKTAESLKVKGLAEMTNQNTTLREPEREPDRLRSSHSQQSNTVKSSSGVSIAAPTSSTATAASSSASICDPQCSMETSSSNLVGSGSTSSSTICGGTLSINQQQQQQSQISINTSSALASISTTNSNFSLAVKRENDRCSPSPPKRLHSSAPSSSPLPLDLYQRRCPSSRSDRHRRMDDEHDLSTSSTGGGGGIGGGSSSIGIGGVSGRLSRTPTTINDEQLSPGSCGLMGDKDREKERDRDKHNNSTDDDDDGGGPNSIGINMTMNSNSSNNGISSGGNREGISNRIGSCGGGGNDGSAGHSSSSQTAVVPSLNSSNTPTSSFHTSDLRPSSRSGGGGGGGGSSSTGIVNMTHTATSSGISSPIISAEPVAGPSGLGPVQSVPLSLKKEIDWERNDDKSGDTIDYRHSHDSETSESPHGGLGGVGTTSTTINAPGSSGGGGNGGSSNLEQNNPIYPCMYCCATFPHQSKLTRHILSHSLETLKYRETAHLLHSGHIANLMPHDLPPLPQHFTHRHGPPGSGLDTMDSTDSTVHSQLDMELHAAAYAAAAAAQSLSGSCNLGGVNSADLLMGANTSSLLAAAAASSQSVLGVNQQSGSTMLGGINNNSNNNNSNSGISGSNTISGNTNSSSAAVAAAVAAATASSSSISATSDPNNVVLCKFCGKSFPDVASLITHLPVHTGDRPFKCEFCGKAFKLRHHMKDHCRVHTGERPFRCGMCGKTFSRSTILKAHEKTHFPKYVRKFLSTSPVDTKDEMPQ